MTSTAASDCALDKSVHDAALGWTKLILPCWLAGAFGFAAEIAILAPSLSPDWSASSAGAATAVQAVGVVLAASVSGRLIWRIGAWQLLRSALIIAAAALFALAAVVNGGAVLASRLLLGLGIGAGVAATEYLVLAHAPPHRRAIYLSIYSISGALGIAGGPLLPYLGVATGTALRLVGACLLGSAVVALFAVNQQEQEAVSRSRTKEKLGGAPAYIWGAALLYGALHTGFLNLAGRYAVAMGHSSEDGALITFAALIGIVALQLPCGYLSSKSNPSLMLLVCSGLAAILIASLPFASSHGILLHVWMFALGGVIDCIYTSGLCSAALTVRRDRLASVTCLYVAACSMGEVLGPLGAGHALDACGPLGLIWVFAGLALVIASHQLHVLWNVSFRNEGASVFGNRRPSLSRGRFKS